MKMEIYHQLGSNWKWNLDSISLDGTGDGAILAPRYMKRDKIQSLSAATKAAAIFDPQFFLPGIARGNLSGYDFFPEIVAGGFDTTEYSGKVASQSADLCVAFQIAQNYRYVVIPTRHVEGMPTNLTDQQQDLFVDPFLHAIKRIGTTKPVALQLILNSPMLKDAAYVSHLLNWVTGIKGIDAVYLIVEVTPRRTKQLRDIDTLYHLLNFIYVLSENQIDVIVGYLNIEALLLAIANPKIVTMGAYEVQRMFNVRPFREPDSSRQSGPTPRVYVSKLLQLIDHNYIGAVERELPTSETFFDQNRYQALMFQPTYQWWFNKPELYKHYFYEFSKQLRMIGNLELDERYCAVRDMIAAAQAEYWRLGGIAFDDDSSGSHLPAWLTAVQQFGHDQGWV